MRLTLEVDAVQEQANASGLPGAGGGHRLARHPPQHATTGWSASSLQATRSQPVEGEALEGRQEAARRALDQVLDRLVKEARVHLDARKRDDARLARDLRASDPLVRDAATLALVARRNRAAIPALVERLQGDDPLEVRRAIGGLVELQAREAVPELIEISRGKDPGFLRELVYALGAIGGDEAQAYLYTMSQGHDQPARSRRRAPGARGDEPPRPPGPGPAPAKRRPLSPEIPEVTIRRWAVLTIGLLGCAHEATAPASAPATAAAAQPPAPAGVGPLLPPGRWGTAGRTRRRTWASARRARWSWWRSGTAATSTGMAGRSASTARGYGTRSATCSTIRSPSVPPGPAWWLPGAAEQYRVLRPRALRDCRPGASPTAWWWRAAPRPTRRPHPRVLVNRVTFAAGVGIVRVRTELVEGQRTASPRPSWCSPPSRCCPVR